MAYRNLFAAFPSYIVGLAVRQMQPALFEPMVITGPCGISCAICRFRISGQCECRIGKESVQPDEPARSPCPVMQCAAARDIDFCARDCPDFLCLLLERTIPYRWSRLCSENSEYFLRPEGRPHPLYTLANQKDANQNSDVLYVYCLGLFRVFRGDEELKDSDWGHGKGPTKKIKALLAYLLCAKARGARKEALMDLLWPQQNDPKRASSSFHQALFHLRRALEPDLQVGSASNYIRCRGERYYFDPQGHCWIDADAFASYVSRAQALERSGDCAAAAVYWGTAITLYRGDFMAGIDVKYTDSGFYNWCAPSRYRLEQLFLEAKMGMARHHIALHQYESAIEHAREILHAEPTFESAHCLLMQCLMESGQVESALAQYRACETELALHQDRAPSEQTRTLYQSLLKSLQPG